MKDTRQRMRRAGAAAVVLAGCACCHAGAPNGENPWAKLDEPATERPLVVARLLADAAAVRPGATVTLGVLFDIEKNWHIYWKNPGQAGVATEVTFAAPPGAAVGPLTYPVPRTFADPGGIVTYGYAGRVLLTARARMPKTLEPGSTVTFKAAASWLACKDKCVLGSADLVLRLPVAAPNARPAPANASLFAAWAGLLPVAAGEKACPAAVAVAGRVDPRQGGGRFDVALTWKGPAPSRAEVYPGPAAAATVSRVTARTDGKRTVVGFTVTTLKGLARSGKTLEVLVVAVGPGKRARGVVLTVPLAGESNTK